MEVATISLQSKGLDFTHTGTTKVDHYKWRLKDSPGEFAMLPKLQLKADDRYQRPSKEQRILAIARDWSWIACGVIIVAMHPDTAEFMVIDGKHRVGGAMRRADITELPCLVFEMHDVSLEAGGFLSANTARRPLSMVDRFKAMTLVNDPGALLVHRLAEAIGRVVAGHSGPTTLTCIRAVMDCAKTDQAAVERIWPVLGALCEGHPLPHDIVRGAFHLETRLKQGASLSQDRWRSRLLAAGYDRVMECIGSASAFRGNRAPPVLAEGIAKAIDTKAKYRIPFGDAASSVPTE